MRRARIEAEKVAGIRNRRGELVRLTRAAIILRLTSRPGGATVQQIADACGWQRHTLRGYIGGTLRKRGHDIRIVRTKGEPARYVLEPTQ